MKGSTHLTERAVPGGGPRMNNTHRFFAASLLALAISGTTCALREVKLAAEAKQTLEFALSGTEGFGTGTLVLRVEGGGHVVNREFDVPVRAAWGDIARSQARTVAPGSALTLDRALAEGLMPGTVSARMTLTTQPPIPFARALQDLLAYPYGCVEQTTTRGYAALLLDADSAKRMGFTGLDEDARRRQLEGAFSRLAALQAPNGHFSMWGGSDTMPILTPYVAEFLLAAREAGFAVPEAMLQKALERLNEDLLTGGLPFYAYDESEHLRFATQAHAAYVLARLTRAPLLLTSARHRSLQRCGDLRPGVERGRHHRAWPHPLARGPFPCSISSASTTGCSSA